MHKVTKIYYTDCRLTCTKILLNSLLISAITTASAAVAAVDVATTPTTYDSNTFIKSQVRKILVNLLK